LQAAIVGWGSLIIIAGIVFGQATTWLKTAVWEPYTIADALRDWGVSLPYTPHLLGVQKIIDGLLLWPAAVGYAAICAGGLAIWGVATAKLEKMWLDERLAEQAKERASRERENREAAKEDAEKSRAGLDFLGEFERALGKRREE
jgi:hypothetical protein